MEHWYAGSIWACDYGIATHDSVKGSYMRVRNYSDLVVFPAGRAIVFRFKPTDNPKNAGYSDIAQLIKRSEDLMAIHLPLPALPVLWLPELESRYASWTSISHHISLGQRKSRVLDFD